MKRLARSLAETLAPGLFILALLLVWELGVELGQVPSFILPPPSMIGHTLIADWPILWPALVFTAGLDPLRDEGQAYAERLSAAGVKTIHREFESLIHGFIGMRGALQGAARALDEMVTGLRHELARLGR